MIEFIAATYNEEAELDDLINHVLPYVDKIHIMDDVSTDGTVDILQQLWEELNSELGTWEEPFFTWHQMLEHTGLPETVKHMALQMCQPDSWVIMLDCDERFPDGTLQDIVAFVNSPKAEAVTHVWFELEEYIDGINTRGFLKSRLFKAEAASFSDSIHVSEGFFGQGVNMGWQVIHRKTSDKQVRRELEYIQTYKKLLDSGKISADRYNELMRNHYFVKVPHG